MKLVKILPDKIQIKTDDAEFKNCRLNDLISVSDGEVELVTTITAITDNDAETQMDDNAVLAEMEEISLKVIECSILGSVVDGEFKQQIDRYPSTDVVIRKIDKDEFLVILPNIYNSFEIGNFASYGIPAYIDGNKFYQRHSCIVGNTGCGKSETVTKIIEETAKNTNCNIVIFDIHGEYSQLSYVDSIKMGEVPFPIWMLGFADMAANVLKVKEDSTVVMSALRKAYYGCRSISGNESKPLYFKFENLMEYMENLNTERIEDGVYATGEKKGTYKFKNGDYNGKLNGIVNTMETLYKDKRYSFLFKNKPQGYLLELMNRIMGGDKPVKNIDLSGIPHDIAVLIIGAITKLIYNIQIMQKDARPITLVCDEAHVYIPTDFQLSAAQRRMVEIFENIAKEGRKFGITLFVASQRPSELNKAIMAQCANYIVMKLNNENDKSMIKGMMPAGSADVIETTTMFIPGDCLVVGDACPIPLKIHVELAKERPQSKTIQFWDEWSKERESVDYGACLEEYLEN
ncbi:MAG: ATP-binding protein [Bacteroidales bacterium]|nr:ATP-binding protein [Lachnoclostridium sp.]MCM1385280.1 ATP-binding protein [Lachnoclostridium sp.]MCM1466134.1 ATP-binding protein [Bacteroidales bacterium]